MRQKHLSINYHCDLQTQLNNSTNDSPIFTKAQRIQALETKLTWFIKIKNKIGIISKRSRCHIIKEYDLSNVKHIDTLPHYWILNVGVWRICYCPFITSINIWLLCKSFTILTTPVKSTVCTISSRSFSGFMIFIEVRRVKFWRI